MIFQKIKLEDNEKLLTVVHKHWYTLFRKVIGIAFVALVPLIGWIAISILSGKYDNMLNMNPGDYISYFIFFYSVWLLFSWMSLALMVTNHHLDIWAVTDRRIISIDQVALFRRHVGSFRLEKLQDVNIEIDGFIATMLDFGTVEAQTASGSAEEFRAHNLPNPRNLKTIILQAADGRIENHNDGV